MFTIIDLKGITYETTSFENNIMYYQAAPTP